MLRWRRCFSLHLRHRLLFNVFMNRLWVVISLFFLPMWLLAQQEGTGFYQIDGLGKLVPETKTLSPNPIAESYTDFTESSIWPYRQDAPSLHIPLRKPVLLPYAENFSPLFKGDFVTDGVLFSHRHGQLYGKGSQVSLPGIGRRNEAAFVYSYALHPNWTLQVEVNADKMLMPHFSGQAFGVDGMISYHATERLTFNVFGNYYTGYFSGMQSYRYGASVVVDMTEKFGMEVGMQRVYSPMAGQWENIPIVAPYFKLNKTKLGIDVGSILHEILREATYKSGFGRRGNPTIGPPPVDFVVR